MTDRYRRVVDTLSEKWDAFWFTPEPAYTLGLIRMAYGALVVAWTLTMLPDLYAFFGANGALPQHLLREYE